jgi:predicted secreted protein
MSIRRQIHSTFSIEAEKKTGIPLIDYLFSAKGKTFVFNLGLTYDPSFTKHDDPLREIDHVVDHYEPEVVIERFSKTKLTGEKVKKNLVPARRNPHSRATPSQIKSAEKNIPLLVKLWDKTVKLCKERVKSELAALAKQAAAFKSRITKIGTKLGLKLTERKGHDELVYSFANKDNTIRIEYTVHQGRTFRGAVMGETLYTAHGKTFTFNRTGVDDSFYPEFKQSDAEIESDMKEQLERATKSIERLSSSKEFNLGPKTIFVSDEGLKNIVDKLKRGETYTSVPASPS